MKPAKGVDRVFLREHFGRKLEIEYQCPKRSTGHPAWDRIEECSCRNISQDWTVKSIEPSMRETNWIDGIKKGEVFLQEHWGEIVDGCAKRLARVAPYG